MLPVTTASFIYITTQDKLIIQQNGNLLISGGVVESPCMNGMDKQIMECSRNTRNYFSSNLTINMQTGKNPQLKFIKRRF